MLLTRQQIAEKVAELGRRITADYRGEPVLLVGVLKGAAIFLADLARQIDLDVGFDFIAVSSYGHAQESSGEVRLVKDVDQSVAGQNLILVEDILDTGLTLNYLRDAFRGRGARSVKIAALLNKASRRVVPVDADYIGFDIPNVFVVGYGLDFADRYRNLSDICILES